MMRKSFLTIYSASIPFENYFGPLHLIDLVKDSCILICFATLTNAFFIYIQGPLYSKQKASA